MHRPHDGGLRHCNWAFLTSTWANVVQDIQSDVDLGTRDWFPRCATYHQLGANEQKAGHSSSYNSQSTSSLVHRSTRQNAAWTNIFLGHYVNKLGFVPQLPVTARSNLPAHSALLTSVQQRTLAPGSVHFVATKKKEEKGRMGIGILWSITRSVRRRNLQIPLSNPFLREPWHVHTCFGHPCSVAVWAQACSLQQLVAQSLTTKISLWLPTTDHLLTLSTPRYR
jgi:hypothetical protein